MAALVLILRTSVLLQVELHDYGKNSRSRLRIQAEKMEYSASYLTNSRNRCQSSPFVAADCAHATELDCPPIKATARVACERGHAYGERPQRAGSH